MIFNIANGPIRRTPVLDESYPKDVSAGEVGTSVTFNILIAEPGKPEEYTCQWYYDGAAVSGATGTTYTRTAELGSHSVYCVVTNKAGSVISRTATVKADTQYLYKAGTFYGITGGLTQTGVSLWQGNPNATHQPGSCSVVHHGDHFTVASVGALCAVAHFGYRINLTGFNTLYYHGGASENQGHTQIGIWTSLNPSGANLNRAAMLEGPLSTVVHSIDISSLNGEYVIGFLVSGFTNYNTISVYNVWLQ